MAMAKDTMIWVVDDDPELRKMVGTYLIDQGYDVRSLCDVKQFEARLECQRPDLVVLDLMLPGDDALTALRRLRDAGAQHRGTKALPKRSGGSGADYRPLSTLRRRR